MVCDVQAQLEPGGFGEPVSRLDDIWVREDGDDVAAGTELFAITFAPVAAARTSGCRPDR